MGYDMHAYMSEAMSTENMNSEGRQPLGAMRTHSRIKDVKGTDLRGRDSDSDKATTALSFCPISAGPLCQDLPRLRRSQWPP